jgi:hypothetical protein
MRSASATVVQQAPARGLQPQHAAGPGQLRRFRQVVAWQVKVQPAGAGARGGEWLSQGVQEQLPRLHDRHLIAGAVQPPAVHRDGEGPDIHAVAPQLGVRAPIDAGRRLRGHQRQPPETPGGRADGIVARRLGRHDVVHEAIVLVAPQVELAMRCGALRALAQRPDQGPPMAVAVMRRRSGAIMVRTGHARRRIPVAACAAPVIMSCFVRHFPFPRRPVGHGPEPWPGTGRMTLERHPGLGN